MNEFINQVTEIVGRDRIISERRAMADFMCEPRGRFGGDGGCVVFPASCEEAVRIVEIARQTSTPLVAQSGNTGLVGGQIPDDSASQAVISCRLMNKIRDIDVISNTIIAEAGVVLADLQAVALKHDRFFPVSIASQGSCQVGGLVGANAGGSAVLAYGNMRELVLGIEAVLPDAKIWNGLRGLRKNNSGYDLRHLLIGSEGTLGLITAACLRLFPKPAKITVAFVAFSDLASAREAFLRFRHRHGSLLSAFELIPAIAVEIVRQFNPDLTAPLTNNYPWYGLIELSSPDIEAGIDRQMIDLLSLLADDAVIGDGTIAQSNAQATKIWRLREAISPAQKIQGASLKHDVSIPLSAIVEFIIAGEARVKRVLPDCRPVIFGHMGDGNVHFNISRPRGMADEDFNLFADQITDIIYSLTIELGGSISAEHGIGQMKKEALKMMYSHDELGAMKSIKTVLDPDNLFNPGKIF